MFEITQQIDEIQKLLFQYFSPQISLANYSKHFYGGHVLNRNRPLSCRALILEKIIEEKSQKDQVVTASKPSKPLLT